MNLSDFDYSLPDERIALEPARPRDSARLLVVRADGAFEDRGVRDLPGLLRAGDVMVFNDTRTLPASLRAVRPSRDPQGPVVRVSMNLIERAAPDQWRVLAKPGKRLKAGDGLFFDAGLFAEIIEKDGEGGLLLRFDRTGAALDEAVARIGAMPIPPYIARQRAPNPDDAVDYQTVYAQRDGSVATPTAGLHFTDALLSALDAAGIERRWVTLHVGAGTFLPVKTDNIAEHKMHAEWCEMNAETAAALNAAKQEGRRIIAVGTTTLRTLESIADEHGRFRAHFGATDIFITPGHRFRSADVLMTNFHLPKSTLLMLVAAFSGMTTMRKAYAHALAGSYRFLSYGDACLLERSPTDAG
jgi:S-adenosylmethionine:tRNA ribosyltransferase-isomerase